MMHFSALLAILMPGVAVAETIGPIAGLMPDVRPPGAFVIVSFERTAIWQAQALMAGPLIAPTLGDEVMSDHSQYAPAAGSEAAGFDAIIRQLMVGEPLKPDEEAALIIREWR